MDEEIANKKRYLEKLNDDIKEREAGSYQLSGATVKKIRALQDKVESLTEKCGKLSKELEEERAKPVLEKMDRETIHIITEAASSVVLKKVNGDKDLYQTKFLHEKAKFTNTVMMGIDSPEKLAMLDKFAMEYPVTFGEQFNLTYKLNIKTLLIPAAKDLSKQCRVFFA